METNERGRLVELSEDECWELLASVEVGRIAWATATGPQVVPVNHVTHGTELRVRTPAYSALVQEADDQRVAFEADRLDPVTRTGWSVVAHGRVEVRYGADSGAGPLPDPWPAGSRHTLLVVVVDEITGRRITSGG